MPIEPNIGPTEPIQPIQTPTPAVEKPWDVPFTGIQPEQVRDFPMSPEFQHRNLVERWGGHRDELVQAQSLWNSLDNRRIQAANKLDELEPGLTVGSAIGRWMTGGIISAVWGGSTGEEVEALKVQLQAFERGAVTAQWRVMMLNDGVESIESGLLNTADEMFAWKAPNGSPLLRAEMRTPQLEEWAKALFKRTKETQQKRIREYTADILNKPSINIVNIDDLTFDEIAKAWRTPAVSKLPEGVSVSDLRSVMKEVGFEDESITSALDEIQSKMEERLSAWADILNSQHDHDERNLSREHSRAALHGCRTPRGSWEHRHRR